MPSSNHEKERVDLDFLEPLNEGLGHSFCYVRPVVADSLAITSSVSEWYTVDSSTFDSETYSGSFRKEVPEDLQRPNKSLSETTFKFISVASVSANASTACTGNLNVLLASNAQVPTALFESMTSFAIIPLQPVPHGSGPLNGFLSGSLERGFMSGPIDKAAFMSDPPGGTDKSNFSAPLVFDRRGAYFGRLVRSVSRPIKNALSRTFTEYSNTRNLQWAHSKAGQDRVHVVLSEHQGWLFVEIYDGFSGPDAPEFLMSNLYKAIDKELEGLLWVYDDKPGNSTSSSNLKNNAMVSLNCVLDGYVVYQLCDNNVNSQSCSDYFGNQYDEGHKQMMKRSFIISKLGKMFRKQKSLRKKLFPWSYDWHRDKNIVDERILDPLVFPRKCKLGPVDHVAVLKAISRALETTEEAYMQMVEKALDINPELALMGVCVLVMLMTDQDVYVMNLGDSRVILAQHRLHDHNTNINLAEDDVRHLNRSRVSLVRVELDRISEESPMHNPKSQICKVNKNREISLCRLKMRAVQLSTDHNTYIEKEIMRIKIEHVDDAQAIINDRVKG